MSNPMRNVHACSSFTEEVMNYFSVYFSNVLSITDGQLSRFMCDRGHSACSPVASQQAPLRSVHVVWKWCMRLSQSLGKNAHTGRACCMSHQSFMNTNLHANLLKVLPILSQLLFMNILLCLQETNELEIK